MNDIYFVGNGRCYHTMDWFRATRKSCPGRTVALLTDLINSEGHQVLVDAEDDVRKLVMIDWLLLRGQSRIGDLWRNAVKLAFVPVQAWRLREFARDHGSAVFHAHTMYYMLLCWLARVSFVGTPQGSEVLVRPHRSRFYRWFAKKALKAASVITVDSVAMQDQVQAISGRSAQLVQNGIDIESVSFSGESLQSRKGILSIRGFTELYRIHKILEARNRSPSLPSISFIYPFWDEKYRAEAAAEYRRDDRDLGRVGKAEMASLLWKAALVVSIPSSDSSPRSVYEAIFAGAPVATVYARWVDALPLCMRERLVLVDIEDRHWLEKAIRAGSKILEKPYLPSDAAIEMFSQRTSVNFIVNEIYTRWNT